MLMGLFNRPRVLALLPLLLISQGTIFWKEDLEIPAPAMITSYLRSKLPRPSLNKSQKQLPTLNLKLSPLTSVEAATVSITRGLSWAQSQRVPNNLYCVRKLPNALLNLKQIRKRLSYLPDKLRSLNLFIERRRLHLILCIEVQKICLRRSRTTLKLMTLLPPRNQSRSLQCQKSLKRLRKRKKSS